MATDKLYLKCLLHLHSFETYWAYFFLSEGKLYQDESRQSAGELTKSLSEVTKIDAKTLQLNLLQAVSVDDKRSIAELLLKWHGDRHADIINTLFMHYKTLYAQLASLKRYLHNQLGITFPVHEPDGTEIMYRESFIRWQEHFPALLLTKMSHAGEILDKANASDTIVVLGDIRRSQELMTYARDEESFTTYMVQFIEHTRRLIDDNMGIFGRFTGDGFVCYFNKAICAMQGGDYKECFLNFVSQENDFATQHFVKWCETVRKLPDIPVGLCIGADLGKILFQDINYHFMAGGDAIVWAQRMTEVGAAQETIVNNLLYAELKEMSGIKFASREGRTKTGEYFLAKTLEFKNDESKNE